MTNDSYRPETYGDRIADVYDDLIAIDDQEAAAAFLAGLAGAGPALELGIGTGRVALSLARHGVEVHGVDASEAMVAKLRAKPGGEAIRVILTDMADLDAVPGGYALVFVLFNTFFALLTQDDQVRCFAQVAERLCPGGAFVIQAFVPDPDLLRHRGEVTAVDVDADHVRLVASRRDPVTQLIMSSQVLLTPAGARLYPVKLRYAWPAELDLMARLAGLRLEGRWGDWSGGPVTPASRHVSVYRKPG